MGRDKHVEKPPKHNPPKNDPPRKAPPPPSKGKPIDPGRIK